VEEAEAAGDIRAVRTSFFDYKFVLVYLVILDR
jgi:hypothetical protein